MTRFELMIAKQRRRARKALGLCQDCPSLALEGRMLCAPCLKRLADHRREVRTARRAAGLCACGRKPAARGRAQCHHCRARDHVGYERKRSVSR